MTETNLPFQQDQGDERRQYHRLDRASKIRYQTLQSLSGKTDMIDAELCDFSGGGIRFITPESIPKNEQVVIELNFTGWQENGDDWVRTGKDTDVGFLKAIGAVMWCSESEDSPGKYEIGLRFTGRVRD